MGELKRRMSDFKNMEDRELLILTVQAMQTLQSDIADIKLAVFGDGNGTKGLRLRVDALETKLDRIEKVLAYVALFFAGSMLTLLWAIITQQVVITFP